VASVKTVAVVRCTAYERKRLRDSVEGIFDLAPEAAAKLSRGAAVLLKPNLLSSTDPPERAVNTHPEFVRAVAEFCRDRGCVVRIGDSCGSLAPGSTRSAIEISGLDKVAQETGAELVNFDTAPSVEVPIPNGRILRRVRISKPALDAAVLITLPKMKTHGLTLLTGAVKNQLGVVPGAGKKDIHCAAPKPASMSQALVDIYSVLRPHVALMDGIVAMEGNGPAAGEPRNVGLVLGSDDGVALDAVVARIMGYPDDVVMTTRLANAQGLGNGDRSAIRTVGLPLAEAAVPDFKRPPHRLQGVLFKFIPDFLASWVFGQLGSAHPVILEDRCALCGECVLNCPVHALRIEHRRLITRPAECISCYCCSEVCRQRAIRMRRPLVGRALHGLARKRSA
jgi:uncharacterized protein (DUF362 family)/NAD-dependent dihydropyrimidine dehydrogenase PreA subunit